jgi:alkylhydroperoxidase/carboxymuconolactone decarboxylase family protein YurZ
VARFHHARRLGRDLGRPDHSLEDREEEFKLHVRPALRNGVTIEELRALLLQASVYAGVPAANAAFRWVKEVLSEEELG